MNTQRSALAIPPDSVQILGLSFPGKLPTGPFSLCKAEMMAPTSHGGCESRSGEQCSQHLLLPHSQLTGVWFILRKWEQSKENACTSWCPPSQALPPPTGGTSPQPSWPSHCRPPTTAPLLYDWVFLDTQSFPSREKHGAVSLILKKGSPQTPHLSWFLPHKPAPGTCLGRLSKHPVSIPSPNPLQSGSSTH